VYYGNDNDEYWRYGIRQYKTSICKIKSAQYKINLNFLLLN